MLSSRAEAANRLCIVVVLSVLALFAPPTFLAGLSLDALSTGAGEPNIWAAGSQMLKHNFILRCGNEHLSGRVMTAYDGAGTTLQG